jgi:tRNA A37 threonylcarbamoyladenosine synthetase subunit TsaC/SUA5/YrdC
VPAALINALGSPLYGITAKRNLTVNWNDDDYFDDYNEANDDAPAASKGGAKSNDDEDAAAAIEENFFREEMLFDGGWELEDIRGLDIILDPGEDQNRIFSTVLDLRSSEVKALRIGAGAWPV